ncbi:putative phage protein [Nostocoides japonicum T1-X7]|uniref:Putative phage protein n=1 Tax=Nostocoides japonicum T1-X7 TaxID=1194083 RepID=A0A077M0K1_9MICO|nr:phage tail tape measure protein [Tetrasphaera japonica]CCH77740.1 putative phage protein [Tetrasphaera japonica T1-X7]
MADRSIVVRIRAEVSGFKAALDDVSASTRKASKDTQKAFAGTDTILGKVGVAAKTNGDHIDRLGRTAAIAGGAIALGIGLGVKSFASFDKAMSGVRAALPDAGNKMDDLRKLAIKLGADTQYSAAEAADGITALAKAGVSASDILNGGLKGALDLAASGQMQVADAAEVAASAMTQFGLSGTQVPHIADLLAAAAGKAQGDVSDMAQALNQTGLIAHQTGLSIEETTGGLAAFASAGLIGSDAGTSFKTMLQRLTPTSQQAKKEMEELGVSAYDSQGNFIGLANFAGNLRDAMKDLTPEARASAMAIIFGSDSVRAANVLYNQGAAGIQKWINNVNEAGYASKQAATLTDNLSGDVERFGGALDSVFVQNGSAANGALRKLVQSATGAVDAFSALPGPVQASVAGVAGLSAVGLLAAAGLARLVTSGTALVESLRTIRSYGSGASKSLDVASAAAKRLGVAFAVTVAAAQFTNLGANRAFGIDSLTKSMLDAQDAASGLSGFLKENSKGNWWNASQVKSYADALDLAFNARTTEKIDNVMGSLVKAFGGSNDSAIAEAKQRLEEVDQALAGLASSGHAQEAAKVYGDLTEAAQKQGVSAKALATVFPQYSDALAGVANQSQLAGEGAKAGSVGIDQIGTSADTAASKVKDLADALVGLGSGFRDERSAARDYRDAIRDINTAIKNAGGKRLGSDQQAELLDKLAQNTLSWAAAAYKAGAGTEKTAGIVAKGRASFIALAEKLGLSATAAKQLADNEELIPKDVKTLFATNLDEAGAKVKGYKGSIGKVPTSKATQFTVPGAAESDGRVKGLTTSIRKVPTSHDTKVDAPGAVLTKSAVDRVRDSILRVPTSHNTQITVDTGRSSAQIAALVAQIHGMPTSRTIMVQTKMSTILDKAGGGAVYGPGSGTSDDVPARLSNGEHVFTAAEVQAAGGQAAIYRLRAGIRAGMYRFAGGGAVGYATGGAVVPNFTTVDYRAIAAVLASATNPIRDLAVATAAVSKAQKAYADTVKKSGRSSERAKSALDKLTAAQTSLKDVQKQLAESAKSAAQSISQAFTTGWSSASQWARIMSAGAGEIATFNGQIERLRKAGLNETLVQQIIGLGADSGSKVAAQLLGTGGSSLIKQLNSSNAALTKAADALGLIAAKGVGRYSYGGFVSGPGTATSDSIPAYLSDGEYVMRAAAVARYGLHRLDAMNALRLADGGPVGRAMWSPHPQTVAPHIDRSQTYQVYGPSAEQVIRLAQAKQRMADAIPDWSGMGV